MITPELISYIKIERSKGSFDQIIKTTLLTQGWTEEDVIEAMSVVDGNDVTLGASGNVPVPPTSPSRNTQIDIQKPLTAEELERLQKIKRIAFALSIAFSLILVFWYMTNQFLDIYGWTIIGFVCLIFFATAYSVGTPPGRFDNRSGFGIVAGILFKVVISILVGLGVLFGGCVILLSTGSLF